MTFATGITLIGAALLSAALAAAMARENAKRIKIEARARRGRK